MKIRVGIFGYGNLGRGIECAVNHNEDMTLAAVFTRRNPETVKILTEGVPVYHADDVLSHKDEIDVMVLCGGSATDLPVQTPMLAAHFNVVDSFDTHAKIPEHFDHVDKAAKEGGKVALISAGWDPGMFSLNRLYANAVLPNGADYTFWGKGVSQGHSDAIRRIDGVLDARQYTVPVERALEAVRSGSNPVLTTREKYSLICTAAAGSMNVSREFSRFVTLVLKNGRESMLQYICVAFLNLYRSKKHIGVARLVTAVPVSTEVEERIRKSASTTLHARMELHTEVDTSIEGGFIFDINDYRLDASIATQLRRVKQQFIDKNRRIV